MSVETQNRRKDCRELEERVLPPCKAVKRVEVMSRVMGGLSWRSETEKLLSFVLASLSLSLSLSMRPSIHLTVPQVETGLTDRWIFLGTTDKDPFSHQNVFSVSVCQHVCLDACTSDLMADGFCKNAIPINLNAAPECHESVHCCTMQFAYTRALKSNYRLICSCYPANLLAVSLLCVITVNCKTDLQTNTTKLIMSVKENGKLHCCSSHKIFHNQMQ